ncbi:hypothetical protein D3C85_1571830 [compost metagenome]
MLAGHSAVVGIGQQVFEDKPGVQMRSRLGKRVAYSYGQLARFLIISNEGLSDAHCESDG